MTSRLAYGCAGLGSWGRQPPTDEEVESATKAIHIAYENGITLFDHADVYLYGKAETIFGRVLKQSPGLRDKIQIQSKCGQTFAGGGKLGDPIHPDLSRSHIVSSVEGSLQRLGTDRLDVLLLHVADALVQPDEVAAAFDDLHRAGKVKSFGVSNYNASQIELLRRSVRQPIVANQIRISLAYPDALAEGLEFTLQIASGISAAEETPVAGGQGTLDYCRSNGIQVQAWWPLRGVLSPPSDARPEIKKTAAVLEEVARNKGTTSASVALAWLLNHPARIVPVIGAKKPAHIVENCAAVDISLSRAEWYTLFAATRRNA